MDQQQIVFIPCTGCSKIGCYEQHACEKGLATKLVSRVPIVPVQPANEHKSYVGNFGDTGEAQLRRELANVPLPNYMQERP